MVVLFDRFLHSKEGDPVEGPAEEVVRWALAQEPVCEECRRVWNGLGQDEQLALSRLVQGGGVSSVLRELLLLKGVLREVEGGRTAFGSPVLREYVRTQASIDGDSFRLDEPAAALWVEGRRVSDLTRLEFELLRYLYRRRGQVCSREEILGAIYPDERIEAIGGDNRVDSLMRHLRRAVEPVPEQPRYLLTVRGHGYRLVDKPEPTR
ncbi:MAG: winged helix-turn-helix domain-containing protein, partial [Caldilinea sp.]